MKFLDPIGFSSIVLIAASPQHIHVRREQMTCKFWLDPIALASNKGFSPHELNHIRFLIELHYQEICEAWDEPCGR